MIFDFKKLASLAALSLTCGVLLGCSLQNQPVPATVGTKPISTVKPPIKPPFVPVDLRFTHLSSHNGEVIIEAEISTTGEISRFQVLATILRKDRKSQRFRLKTNRIGLSAQDHEMLRYNRRQKMLTSDDWSSIMGMGSEHSRTACRNVTEADIFKMANMRYYDDLRRVGCDCKTTDLSKPKKHRKQK